MSDCCDRCRSCPVERDGAITRGAPSEVAIILDYPTSIETGRNKLLSGDSGLLAKKVLARHGIKVEDCYVTTALNCRPIKDKEAMLKKAMLSCRDRLLYELKDAGVKKVLSIGTMGYSALSRADKNLPITKVRGKWYTHFGMQILPTVPLSMILGSPDWIREFTYDVQKFATTDGPEPFPQVERWHVEDLQELDEAFDYLQGASYVSLDIESTGFSPVRDRLLAVGLGVLESEGTGGVTVILDKALLEKRKTWTRLMDLVNSEQATVAHNLKFDAKWVKAGADRMGVTWAPQNMHDTMLLHYCQDERPVNGQWRSHGLKGLSRTRYDAPDYDIEMGKWLKEYTKAQELDRRKMEDEMHTYLALDCYYTARLYPDLWNEVLEEDEKLLDLYENLLIPATMTFVEIELRGAPVDRVFFEALSENLDVQIKQVLGNLQTMTGVPDFNPGSPKQVEAILYEGGLSLPRLKTSRRGKQQGGATSQEVLSKLKRHLRSASGDLLTQEEASHATEVIDLVLHYRKLAKTKGTYADGMLDRMDYDDRIRGDFNIAGTATGRISSSNPNLQNIPDSSHTGIEIRNGFAGHDEDTLLIEADYSQLELRIAALLSGDEAFKDVFRSNRDVHQEVVWALFKKTKQEASKYERYMAKCMNFGVMYMRGPDSLANGPEMDYIEDNGGTRWTVAEVSEFFKRMLGQWHVFGDWIENQQRIAYRQGYVQNPLGFKRRFPFIPSWDKGATGRAGVNTPIQGLAAEFTLWAIVNIHRRFKEEGLQAWVVSTVHDSIQVECKKNCVDRALVIMHEEMEQHTPIECDLPFKSDADVAERWGQMGKWSWDSDSQLLAAVAEED